MKDPRWPARWRGKTWSGTARHPVTDRESSWTFNESRLRLVYDVIPAARVSASPDAVTGEVCRVLDVESTGHPKAHSALRLLKRAGLIEYVARSDANRPLDVLAFRWQRTKAE